MRSGCAIILSDYIGGEGAASGGAGHAALDSFRALRAAGADVRVVAGFGTVPQVDATRFATLGGEDLRTGGASGAFRTIYNPRARASLVAELAGADRDTTLIILHQWTRYLSPAALEIASRFPTMIYMHDYFWPCPNGAYYDFREGRPCDRRPMHARCLLADCDREGRLHKAGRVVRQAARRAVTHVPPTRRLFLHLSELSRRTAGPLLPGQRHEILYNPLPAKNAPSPAPSPRYDVGYFGRLEPEKGVGLLIDAAVSRGLSGLFVGQGALAGATEAHDRLEHRAWLPRDAVADAMRSCRVVVLPSIWRETWGLVVPEAMAAGVPVLVSSRAGSAELVHRFGGGATFDPGAEGALSASLGGLLANPPAPIRDHVGLLDFLSPTRHAGRIMALAGSHFGLDLREAAGHLSAA